MKLDFYLNSPAQMRLAAVFMTKLADLQDEERKAYNGPLNPIEPAGQPAPAETPDSEPAPSRRARTKRTEPAETPEPEKTEPAIPPEQPAPAPAADSKKLTHDDCRDALKRACDKHGLPAATKILGTFSVKSVSALVDKDMAAFVQTCDTWKE